MDGVYKKSLQEAQDLADRLSYSIENGEDHPAINEYLEHRKNLVGIDTEQNWNRFWWRANRGRFISAASVAASLLIAAAVSFVLLFDKEEVPSIAEVVNIMPSQGAVVLKLASGEVVDIDSSKRIENRIEGVKIDKETGEISYEEVKEKVSEDRERGLDSKVDMNELTIPKGRSYSVVLSDGTKVWLNALSKLSYPVTFSKRERRVVVDGEAFFEVSKDISRPFVVETSDYNIKVLGTKFNVNSYNNEDYVATTLVEGSVEIPGVGAPSVKIVPGEQFRKSRADGSTVVEPVDTDMYTSWIDNNLRMNGTTLNDILKVIKRRYDVEILFVDKEVGEERFSGKIPLNDNLGVILEQLSRVSNIKFEFESNMLKVTTK